MKGDFNVTNDSLKAPLSESEGFKEDIAGNAWMILTCVWTHCV